MGGSCILAAVRALAIVLTAFACNYAPSPAQNLAGDGPVADGGPDVDSGDAPPDSLVGPPVTPCVAAWQAGGMTFTTPAFLGMVGAGPLATFDDERDPFVSTDELQIYFVKPNIGQDDIFFSSRASTSDEFSQPIAKSTLNDATTADSKTSMTGDDLTAFVASRRAGGEGEADIWQATRTSAGTQAFPTPLTQQHLASVNDGGNQLDPHISPDGLRLYYAQGSPQQLVVAERPDTSSPFGPPTAIANIADASGDADPTLSGDERVLIFTSNRGGGQGGTDLWYATRAERDQPFGTPINLSINTTDQDADAHLTPDGCHLYLASTRSAQGTDYDVFFTQLVLE